MRWPNLRPLVGCGLRHVPRVQRRLTRWAAGAGGGLARVALQWAGGVLGRRELQLPRHGLELRTSVLFRPSM